jgi:hypothetical protein
VRRDRVRGAGISTCVSRAEEALATDGVTRTPLWDDVLGTLTMDGRVGVEGDAWAAPPPGGQKPPACRRQEPIMDADFSAP